MKLIKLNKTNRFLINDIKKNMQVVMSKKMTKKFFNSSITYLNESAPIHKTDLWAKRLGFKGKIFPGLAVTGVFSKIIGMYLPGKNCVIVDINFTFKKPTFENDLLVYKCKVKKVIKRFNIVILDLFINRGKEVLIQGSSRCKILTYASKK